VMRAGSARPPFIGAEGAPGRGSRSGNSQC
jgi:hypothetical protein